MPITHFSPILHQMLPNPSHFFEFVLFDGFSNMVLANALEPLRDVKRRALGPDVSWRISTLTGAHVQSSSGLSIRPDGAFDALGQNRTLIFVTGYSIRDQLSPAVLRTTRQSLRGTETVIGLDTAAWLLAATGALDDHRATIHWQELDDFREAFGRVSVTTERFVQSGRFITCGGASTVLDMTLDLIQTRFGAAAAFEASNMFIYDPARQTPQDRGQKRLRDKASPKLLAALDVMAQHIETPLTTFDLAARVSVSERSLNRIFQSELGMTPGKYYRLFRLQKARYLAEETTLTQEQIALRCGFATGASLARAFATVFGISITELRG